MGSVSMTLQRTRADRAIPNDVHAATDTVSARQYHRAWFWTYRAVRPSMNAKSRPAINQPRLRLARRIAVTHDDCTRHPDMEDLGGTKQKKTPHSTLGKIGEHILPGVARRFLFHTTVQFPVARLLLGAAFGAICGAALFFGLMQNLPITPFHRVTAGYVFVALCVLGSMFSSYFRCSVLLVFPSMLGSRGRAYIMIFVLHCLYQGPISNIQRNVQDVAFSMGCNIDQQIGHSKIMWRVVTEPFVQVLQEIVEDSVKLQREAHNVSRTFQKIREEVMGQYGYDALGQSSADLGSSTQEQYAAKTMMRCDYIVNEGATRCQDWFGAKWQDCMDTIKSPVISHFLCVPMKFTFLCNVMRVMIPWCKEHIPVEGNFGRTFDKLDSSISSLGERFTSSLVFQEEFRKELMRSFQEKRAVVEQIAHFVQVLLTFTFITFFTSAVGYARQFTGDIRFDNVYITTYFRQIDERRRRAGRRYLLPLKKTERSSFINPWSLVIHPKELQLVTGGLVQVFSLTLFVCALLATDGILYHIFDIIHRHTFTEYSLTSSHDVHIDIGGTSMIASLLRKTIGAFNTSSSLDMQSSNQHCLPQPRALSQEEYLWSVLPLLVMSLMCGLQVYTNRLRRVIGAFYFPKREKRRILFLYNLQIQRRVSYVSRQCRRLRSRRTPPRPVLGVLLAPLECLGCRLCWCWVCEERVGQNQVVWCSTPACPALYCPQCWRDLGGCCVCSTHKQSQAEDSSSDTHLYYVS
ncbi:DC-STAMP domain-containing protein 1 isoform X2 [Brachyhypopomus gauderio]|uniref:DC-STAMP domain-containing protein 1 isoform X2 n=1 Tax=Brachyhypopomus gauderio TaxID=698409 RepID=UPI004043594C